MKQKIWQAWQRDLGCVVCGSPAETHHCAGSTAKHNKVWIGEWWTLPLCPMHHRYSPTGIHYWSKEHRNTFHKVEFEKLWNQWCNQGGEFPEDVYKAIIGYHK